jgi:shikimate kinase
MGAGKTSVGQQLAKMLGREFVDLDHMIEAKSGQSVAELFARQGEPAFRNLEVETLQEVMARTARPQVIALGGGAVTQPMIQTLLREHDVLTIFLDAAPEDLYRRCVDSLDAASRPLLQDLSSFKKLYAERLPVYQQAEWHFASAASVEKTVAEIAGRLRSGEGPKRREP